MKSESKTSILPIISGGIFVLSYLIVLFVCRGQYEFIHFLNQSISFPPMWLFNFLYMATAFLFGMSFGLLMSKLLRRERSLQVENIFLKGQLAFTVVYFLSLIWRVVILLLQMPLLGLIISMICAFALFLTLIYWSKLSLPHTILALPYAAWCIYLFVLNMIIVFSI